MSAESSTDKETKGLVPIVIGVTGHRDLVPEHVPRIRKSVELLIRSLREKYPHTPLRVLSPLAEGADRLVAEIGLGLGAELVVVLPMEEDEYRRDFESSTAEFDRLVKQATMVLTLPRPPEARDKDIRTSASARNACYENVGLYVAKHAHVLVALWNGYVSKEQGGTGEVVDYCLHHSPKDLSISSLDVDYLARAVVWHLPVERNLKSDQPMAPGLKPYDPVWHLASEQDRITPFVPPGQSWPDESFARVRCVDDFNTDVLSLKQGALDKVLRNAVPDGADGAAIDPTKRLMYVFAAADLIAAKYQRRAYRLWRWIFIMPAIMVISFESYANVWPHNVLLAVYPAAFIAMTALYLLTSRRRFHDRFIDARNLAEALRVQIYWRLAGIGQSVANVYLRRHTASIGWVLKVLQVLSVLPPPDADFAQRSGVQLADELWIRGQLDYYDRQSRRQHRLVKVHGRLAATLYTLTLVFSVIVVAGLFAAGRESHQMLILFMACGPAIAVLWIAYADKQGWDEQVKEYKRTHALFMSAHTRLREIEKGEDAADTRRRQEILHEIGKEALYENAEWVMLHRQRAPTILMG